MSQLIEKPVFSAHALAVPDKPDEGLRQYPHHPTQGSSHSLGVHGQLGFLTVGQLTQAHEALTTPERADVPETSSSPFMRRNAIRDRPQRLQRQPPVPRELPARVHLDAKGKPLFKISSRSPLAIYCTAR